MSKIPRHIAAALEALKFRGARPEMLRTLSDSEWQDLLSLSDPMHLTLSLGKICGNLPDWVLGAVPATMSPTMQNDSNALREPTRKWLLRCATWALNI